MKRLLRSFATAAIFAIVAGCTPETPETPEDHPQEETPDTEVLSAPELTVTTGESTLSFTWTSAIKEDSEAAVEYALYVGTAGSDLFDKGVSFEADGLSHSIEGEDYIKLLMDFGCKSGEVLDMTALVTATAGKETKVSAEKSFSAGLPAPEIVLPSALYMKGGACPGGWDEATVLTRKEEGVYSVADVTLLFGKSEDGKGFKFFVSEEAYPFYGQDNAEGAAFGDVKIFATENDGDSQFYPLDNGYTSGIYTIIVNLNTMKLTLNKTEDVFEPKKPFYVFGEGLDHSWEMVEDLILNEIEDNVFEGYNIHLYKTSSFKFEQEDWTEYQRDPEAEDYWTVKPKAEGEDFRFVPEEADPEFKNGRYTVRLDLNTMKVTLTLTEEDPDYPLSLYILGDAAVDAKWNPGSFVQMTMVSPGVFKAEHVNIDTGTAVEGNDKGYGFKFCINNDWSTEYGAKEAFDGETAYRGWELAQNGNQFYPLLMGLTSGLYTITADFTTMTVTMTKE